ncbi:keratin, type I cytoskeletal 19-like [Heteronotia binoei]|uniref:keratin, type I cytoskeletal 19-like n=1 Tax=Heteronotia binoei TaxID=13085 RepID=UPI00293046D4|nr:keratin, type I cytoskeletal 19-like [Heteronotia binoei]
MNSSTKYATATLGRSGTSVGSNVKSRLPSASSSHGKRGNFSCQSHAGNSSACSHGVCQSNFSSASFSGGFVGGSYRRRMSTGSFLGNSYGGYSQLGYGDGLIEVGGGLVGSFVGGMGGDPGACGVVFSSVDGKMIMQNLNDRLANYIDQVRCLEAENAALETKIEDFFAQHGHIGETKEYSHYYQQIEELKNQLICAAVENNKILLKIDNHQMNVEDMKQKLETEYGLRQNVEADINGLHPVLDQLTRSTTELEDEFASLQEEICNLKKTHEEELKSLKKQTSEVNVKVSSCPGPDLKKVLEDMRCKYEAMIDLNRKEVAEWYENKLEEVNQEVCTNSKEVESGNQKVIDLRSQLQSLEIGLQTQCNLRDTLQVSLDETECRYGAHLAEIQDQILFIEHQLAELRLEMEDQTQEYKELLNVKNRLEREIETYRHLIEEGQQDHIRGGGAGVTHPSSAGSTGGTNSKSTKRQSSQATNRR